jgi:hypothetical protein
MWKVPMDVSTKAIPILIFDSAFAAQIAVKN